MTVRELIAALQALDVPGDTPVVTVDWLDFELPEAHDTQHGGMLVVLRDRDTSDDE